MTPTLFRLPDPGPEPPADLLAGVDGVRGDDGWQWWAFGLVEPPRETVILALARLDVLRVVYVTARGTLVAVDGYRDAPITKDLLLAWCVAPKVPRRFTVSGRREAREARRLAAKKGGAT